MPVTIMVEMRPNCFASVTRIDNPFAKSRILTVTLTLAS
jgi:hypothetical protein